MENDVEYKYLTGKLLSVHIKYPFMNIFISKSSFVCKELWLTINYLSLRNTGRVIELNLHYHPSGGEADNFKLLLGCDDLANT